MLKVGGWGCDPGGRGGTVAAALLPSWEAGRLRDRWRPLAPSCSTRASFPGGTALHEERMKLKSVWSPTTTNLGFYYFFFFLHILASGNTDWIPYQIASDIRPKPALSSWSRKNRPHNLQLQLQLRKYNHFVMWINFCMNNFSIFFTVNGSSPFGGSGSWLWRKIKE